MRRTVLLGAAALLAGCVAEPRPVIIVQQPGVAVAGCNTAFRVFNASSRTVERLYFSHSSLGGWGADQLGQAVLPPGRGVNFRAANTGNYDFRVVFANGRVDELMRVNVCAASQVTVTNGGLRAS